MGLRGGRALRKRGKGGASGNAAASVAVPAAGAPGPLAPPAPEPAGAAGGMPGCGPPGAPRGVGILLPRLSLAMPATGMSVDQPSVPAVAEARPRASDGPAGGS